MTFSWHYTVFTQSLTRLELLRSCFCSIVRGWFSNTSFARILEITTGWISFGETSHSFSERKQYFLSCGPWTRQLFIPFHSPWNANNLITFPLFFHLFKKTNKKQMALIHLISFTVKFTKDTYKAGNEQHLLDCKRECLIQPNCCYTWDNTHMASMPLAWDEGFPPYTSDKDRKYPQRQQQEKLPCKRKETWPSQNLLLGFEVVIKVTSRIITWSLPHEALPISKVWGNFK